MHHYLSKNRLRMKKTYFILSVMFLIVGLMLVAAPKEGKRVIAHNEKEIGAALEKGCKVVSNARTLKALQCPENAASELGLQEDIRMFAMDAKANTQIRSNLVQASGNVGTGRKIVVLDTGYNYNHPELSSSYLGGKDFVNNDNDPIDDNGHGSHVAGIITADGIN